MRAGGFTQELFELCCFPFSLLIGVFLLSFPLSPFLRDNVLNHSRTRAPQRHWGHKSKTSPSLQGEAW